MSLVVVAPPVNLEFPGYRIVEVLHEGRRFVVVRAVRVDDRTVVVLKTTRTPKATVREVGRLRREFAVSRKVTSANAVAAIHASWQGPRPFVVFDDVSAQPVRDQGGVWSSTTVLDVARGVAHGLSDLHRQRIAHGAIDADHVLYDPGTRGVWLCGLGSASLCIPTCAGFASKRPNAENSADLGGADARWADFAALGRLLFELVGGRPLSGADPDSEQTELDLRPVVEATGGGPSEALVAVIQRLLHDDPVAGFADANALCRALATVDDTGAAKHGPAAEGSSLLPRARPRAPRQSRGREALLERLVSSREHVAASRPTWISVTAREGLGKTALLRDLEVRLAQAPGTVVRCEFLPEARSRPYFLLTWAFPPVLRKLAEDQPHGFLRWRERAGAALGVDAAVVVDRIPQLRGFLAEVPADNRPRSRDPRWGLTHSLVEFIRLFARDELPLTLLLDDVQHADEPSLNVLRRLLTGIPAQPVLVISTATVGAGEARVTPLLQDLQAAGVTVAGVELAPLDSAAQSDMIGDMLTGIADDGAVEALAAGAGGNPLAIHDAVWWAWSEGLLEPNGDNRSWIGDPAEIQASLARVDRDTMFAQRWQRLPIEIQSLLRTAACMGRGFDVAHLAALEGRSAGDTAQAVAVAAEHGFVCAEGPDLGWWGLDPQSPDLQPMARFIHDGLRHRIAGLIEVGERQQLHGTIAGFLMQKAAHGDLRFEIADHWSRAQGVAATPDKRLQMARFAGEAAMAARQAEAYGEGLRLAEAGLALLPEDPWEDTYDLAYELAYERCRCSAGAGESREEVLAWCDALSSRARSDVERLRPLEVRVRFLAARGEAQAAVAAACAGLPELQMPATEQAAAEVIVEHWSHVRSMLADTDVSRALLQVPDRDDPRDRFVEGIISAALHAGWFHSLSRVHALALGILRRVLEGESLPLTGIECCVAAIAVAHGFGDAGAGHRLARAGVARAQARGRWQGSTRLMATAVDWTRRPSTHIEVATQRALRECEKDEWDQLGVSLMAASLANVALCSAALVDIERSLEGLRFLAARVGHDGGRIVEVGRAFVDGFVDGHARSSLAPRMDPKQMPPLVALCDHSLRCQSALIHGDLELAIGHAAKAGEHGHLGFGWFLHLQRVVRGALAWAAAEERPLEERIEQVHDALQQVAQWSTFVIADNIAVHQALLTAELARLQGEDDDALRAYVVAIEGVHETGSAVDRGLVAEWAARFHFGRKQARTSQQLRGQARAAYQAWGAARKVHALDGHDARGGGAHRSARGGRPVVLDAGTAAIALDLAHVSHALRTLATDHRRDGTVAMLLAVAAELAQARYGWVLVEDREGLRIVDAYPQDAVVGRPPAGLDMLPSDIDRTILDNARGKTEPVITDIEKAPDHESEKATRRVIILPLWDEGRAIGWFVLQGDVETLRLEPPVWLALLMARVPAALAASIAARPSSRADPGPAAQVHSSAGAVSTPETVALETTQIEAALREAAGSVTKAARALGTTRTELSRRMKQLGMVRPRKSRKR